MRDFNDAEGKLGTLNDEDKVNMSADMSSTGNISNIQGLTTMRQVASQEADPSTAHRADDERRRGLPRRRIDVESEPIIRTERSKQGRVGWKVYGDYAKSNGLVFVSLYVVALIGSQAAEIGMCIFACVVLFTLKGMSKYSRCVRAMERAENQKATLIS